MNRTRSDGRPLDSIYNFNNLSTAALRLRLARMHGFANSVVGILLVIMAVSIDEVHVLASVLYHSTSESRCKESGRKTIRDDGTRSAVNASGTNSVS